MALKLKLGIFFLFEPFVWFLYDIVCFSFSFLLMFFCLHHGDYPVLGIFVEVVFFVFYLLIKFHSKSEGDEIVKSRVLI